MNTAVPLIVREDSVRGQGSGIDESEFGQAAMQIVRKTSVDKRLPIEKHHGEDVNARRDDLADLALKVETGDAARRGQIEHDHG